MAGSEAIRAGGTDYLPQYPNESDARYEIRKVIAGLFNGYKLTIQAAVGMLCMQEPVLGKDMPKPLAAMWENADGCGMHGRVFAQELITAGMVDGFAGIVTEFPRADDPSIDRSKASLAATIAIRDKKPLDAADEAALGLQPYFILYKADAVLMQLYETVNGKRTLVLLVLREFVQERAGRFGLKNLTRYRVYRLEGKLVEYERWTAQADGEPARDEGPSVMQNLAAIPWSPFAAGSKLEPGEYLPTLIDLADLNIEHHNIKTDMLSLQSRACVPTLVRVGAQANSEGEYPPIELGPSDSIEAPATEGVSLPIYWLSPPIDVLDPTRKSLENNKAEMGAMGASFLTPEPRTQETATAHTLDSTAQKASISTVGQAAQDCLESAFGFAGQYIQQPAGSVTINQEFDTTTMDPALLTAWVSAVQGGKVPVRVFLAAMQKGKLIELDDASMKKLVADAELNQRAEAFTTFVNAGLEWDKAAKLAGFDEETVKLIGEPQDPTGGDRKDADGNPIPPRPLEQ